MTAPTVVIPLSATIKGNTNPLVRLSVTYRGTGSVFVRRKTDDKHSTPLSPMTLSIMKTTESTETRQIDVLKRRKSKTKGIGKARCSNVRYVIVFVHNTNEDLRERTNRWRGSRIEGFSNTCSKHFNSSSLANFSET